MESVSLADSRLPERIGPGRGDGTFPCLDIEFNESAGSVRVYDPRLFQAGRRSFCERLVKAASRQPGIRKAEVDLSSASCQIEFSPGSQTLDCMAGSLVRAVREASAASRLIDRMCWWRCRGRWSALTAFRLPERVSLWETFVVEPGPIRLRSRGVAGNRAQLSRLADALSDLDGVEACRVSPWSHSITIDVYCNHQLSERFLHTVEQELARLKAADWSSSSSSRLSPSTESPACPLGRQSHKTGRGSTSRRAARCQRREARDRSCWQCVSRGSSTGFRVDHRPAAGIRLSWQLTPLQISTTSTHSFNLCGLPRNADRPISPAKQRCC
jgi:hypothetical protein